MSKLSMLEERVTGIKDSNYYLNKCDGSSLVKKIPTPYGYIAEYKVEDQKVVLTFNQYANGEDDFDDELVEIEIYG